MDALSASATARSVRRAHTPPTTPCRRQAKANSGRKLLEKRSTIEVPLTFLTISTLPEHFCLLNVSTQTARQMHDLNFLLHDLLRGNLLYIPLLSLIITSGYNFFLLNDLHTITNREL